MTPPSSTLEGVLETLVTSLQALLSAMIPPPSHARVIADTQMLVIERAASGAEETQAERPPSASSATEAGDEPSHPEDPVELRILVELGLASEAPSFALVVAAALGADDGWAAAGRPFRLGRGSTGTVDVILATPATVDRLCHPLRTGGTYSCGHSGRAVINVDRWRRGASAYTGTLADYRIYVVNHEVGHLLAMPHAACPSRGAKAPVMQQQSKSLAGCTATTRPSPGELDRLRARPRWRDAARSQR